MHLPLILTFILTLLLPTAVVATPATTHHTTPQTTKIKYGPYTVPANSMLNFYDNNATTPCTSCFLTHIVADLEYEDGRDANANTGLWLHHTVLSTPSLPDTVCPSWPLRLFASGNERTPLSLPHKTGLYLPSNTTLTLLSELMSTISIPTSVYVTITYTFNPSPPATDFHPVTPVWLDITGVCGGSYYPVPENKTVFSLEANSSWISTIDGSIVRAISHLHDGGTNLTILSNNNSVCISKATYGASPGYIDSDGMGMHVSNMSVCRDVGRMKKGQGWNLKASYDFGAHEGMMSMDGSLEPVMGISVLFVEEVRDGMEGGGEVGRR